MILPNFIYLSSLKGHYHYDNIFRCQLVPVEYCNQMITIIDFSLRDFFFFNIIFTLNYKFIVRRLNIFRVVNLIRFHHVDL